MKWIVIIFTFLIFTPYGQTFDQKYCADLTQNFTQVRKKLVDMPCSLLEKEETVTDAETETETEKQPAKCESLGDAEDNYKKVLAKLRIRRGIDALHKDLKAKGVDPKVVIEQQKWEDFISTLSLKMALEKSFINENNILLHPDIKEVDHLNQLCEQPNKDTKQFCLFFNNLKTDSDKEKVLNFSIDLKNLALSASDADNPISKEDRLKKVEMALKEFLIKVPSSFAMLYGPNVFINFNKEAMDPKKFKANFDIVDNKVSFKKNADELAQSAKAPKLDQDQAKIIKDLKTHLDIIGQGKSKAEFIKLTNCLYKSSFDDCAKDYTSESIEEIQAEVEKERDEMLNYRNKLADESAEIEKYMFAEAFFLAALNEKCTDFKNENDQSFLSCYEPDKEVAPGEVHFLAGNVRGILHTMREEYDDNGEIKQKALSADTLKNKVCRFEGIEEIKRYCPKKTKPIISGYDKLKSEMENEEKDNQANQIAAGLGQIAAQVTNAFNPPPFMPPYQQTNWNNLNSFTPLGYNPYLMKNHFGQTVYNPNGYNWYQPNLYGQSGWGVANNPYEPGFEYQPINWLDAGH